MTSSQNFPPEFIQAAHNRMINHHKALWEEEKHYTWWIYIIFAATLFIFIKVPVADPLKAILIGFSAIFGAIMSFVAFRVVRKEGQCYTEALQIFNRLLYRFNLPNEKIVIEEEGKSIEFPLFPPYGIYDFSLVESKSNKTLSCLISAFFTGRAGIRDLFQLTFLMSITLHLIVGVLLVGALLLC